MFEYMKAYKKIIVTGPQRSGTTVCAKMIANDTGYRFTDEHGVDDEEHLRDIIKADTEIVIQCPKLSYMVHTVAFDDTLVVMMRRNIIDIVTSIRRVYWSWNNQKELKYYRKGMNMTPSIVAKLKYELWDLFQSKVIINAEEIDYDSLSEHPMWVDKEDRKNFAPKQTEHE